MAIIKPFQCIRPEVKVAHRVAALPYDVYSSEEARKEVEKEPLSFLKIDRAETQFDSKISPYEPCVYEKAGELLNRLMEEGILISDKEECYYLYELIMDGRSQTGIVACASIDDYQNHVIKKHENTREDKEIDRINHVDACNAQTGPIFLAYRSNQIISGIVEAAKKEEALYRFCSPDGISHNVWRIAEKEKITAIKEAFEKIKSIYIADGHHRAASAVKVGLKRRQANPGYDGTEEFNYFLSVLFPHDQLFIMDYNRAVADLNGLSVQEFLEKAEEYFTVTKHPGGAYKPERKAAFGMYLGGTWYSLSAKETLLTITDPVLSLDVSLLQNYLLGPVLGIQDPRTDDRISFIGGIRGLGELERRVEEDMAVAFALYPTSIMELFQVADAEQLMPPKSTWFEPKLRSGLFIHKLQ